MFGCGGSSVNDDPDDFTGELYDYERMVYGRTAISLWDPTARDGVVRTHEDTRVHIPKLDALGGEGTRVGDRYVYRLGDAYLAYLPLGTVAAEEDRGDYVYLRLDGRSGGITELVTTSEFPDLASYAASIESRYLSYEPDPLAAEIDAWDPAAGATTRIRLEYRPERRVIAGAEVSMEEALGHGLMGSPWVSWDPATQVMRVARDCYPSRVYDWANKTITEEPPPADCAGGSGGAGGGAPRPPGRPSAASSALLLARDERLPAGSGAKPEQHHGPDGAPMHLNLAEHRRPPHVASWRLHRSTHGPAARAPSDARRVMAAAQGTYHRPCGRQAHPIRRQARSWGPS